MNNRLFRVLGDIDEALVRDAAPSEHANRSNRLRRYLAAAASFLILIAGIGTYTVSEAAEYQKAIAFFEENDLSAEGLSRGEIKKVYRDITTHTFTYTKTTQVVLDAIGNAVGGYELPALSPSPEELGILWRNRNSPDQLSAYLSASRHTDTYFYYYADTPISDEATEIQRQTAYFDKYQDGALAWRLCFPLADICGYETQGDSLFIYGKNRLITNPEVQHCDSFIVKVDGKGNLLWQTELRDRGNDETVCAVVPESVGVAAFSTYRGSLRVTRLDDDGQTISILETELGSGRKLCNAIALDDGYLLQIKTSGEGSAPYAHLMQMDKNGTLSQAISYASEDRLYYIDDMIEYNGSVWISAHTVPRYEDARSLPALSALSYVVRTYFDTNPSDSLAAHRTEDTVSPSLTEYARGQYEALLMRCDTKDGTPQEFYSVGGAFGGPLAVKNQALVWEVNNISAVILPASFASYVIYGTCHVHFYTFDQSAILTSVEKTTIPTRLQ